MSHKDELDALATREGFRVVREQHMTTIHGLRGILSTGEIILCDIKKSRTPGTNTIGNKEGAAHAVSISTRGVGDGWLYEANGEILGNQLPNGEKGWERISIAHSEKQETDVDELLARYVRHIIGAVAAKESGLIERSERTLGQLSAESFETRANIKEAQNRVRGQKVAIIGAGRNR